MTTVLFSKRHFSLARLVKFGGLLARSDLVDGVNSERILDTFEQVGCFELSTVGVDVASLEPGRSRHVTLLNDVAGDGRPSVQLWSVPHHCELMEKC